MPLYEYKAYNRYGKIVSGLMDAPSRKIIYERLKVQGLFPKDISIDVKTISKGALTNDSLSFVLTQLSALLRSGIPMVKALDSIMSQSESKDLSRALARVKTLIQEGKSFTAALEMEKNFPPLLVKMAAAGEAVGNLELILERYAYFLEKESESVKKITSAMVYPSVVLVCSVILILFILTYITPILLDIFDSFGRQLPIISQILVSFGLFLKNNFIWLIASVCLFIFIFVKYVPKSYKDNIKTSLPFLGQAYRFISYARWARTLGMLHGGGIPLLKALEASRGVVDNVSLENALETVEKNVEKGNSLSHSLASFFPPLLVNMVETGQQTGELENMMNAAADFYEKEADRKITFFIHLFEPAMIVFLGISVGFIVIAVLLPIFEINSLMK